MSTEFDKTVSREDIGRLREELKSKKLKREEINDTIFTEALTRMDLEGRLRMLHVCMFNDTFRRIRYRKTKA